MTANPNVTLRRSDVPRHCQRARTVILGPLTQHELDAGSFAQHDGACGGVQGRAWFVGFVGCRVCGRRVRGRRGSGAGDDHHDICMQRAGGAGQGGASFWWWRGWRCGSCGSGAAQRRHGARAARSSTKQTKQQYHHQQQQQQQMCVGLPNLHVACWPAGLLVCGPHEAAARHPASCTTLEPSRQPTPSLRTPTRTLVPAWHCGAGLLLLLGLVCGVTCVVHRRPMGPLDPRGSNRGPYGSGLPAPARPRRPRAAARVAVAAAAGKPARVHLCAVRVHMRARVCVCACAHPSVCFWRGGGARSGAEGVGALFVCVWEPHLPCVRPGKEHTHVYTPLCP